MTIFASLGSRSYWHLALEDAVGPAADLESSSPADAAAILLSIVQKHRGSNAPWPVQQVVIKAMTIELVMQYSGVGAAIPEALVRLLVWAADVSEDLLDDPAAFYGESWKGGSAPKGTTAKSIASWLELQHFRATGRLMPVAALCRRMGDFLGADKAPARSTIRAWRQEPDYIAFVELN